MPGGVYAASVALDAPPAPGRFGLIGISHGSGGGGLNHHDLGECLARSGYVVVAPFHRGDRPGGFRGRAWVLGRAEQLRRALRAAMTDAATSSVVDADRVGLFGFSAGGCTALVVAGARPRFSAAEDAEDPGEPEEPAPFRIRGLAAAAPYASVFDAAGVAGVHAPSLILRAESDTVTENRTHADRLTAALPGQPEIMTVPGGHFVFMAPVDAATAGRFPQYYRDGEGVDRAAIHLGVNRRIRDFFAKNL